jgi:hypothetical protein
MACFDLPSSNHRLEGSFLIVFVNWLFCSPPSPLPLGFVL